MSYCRNGKEIRESTGIEAIRPDQNTKKAEQNQKRAQARLKERLAQIVAERYGGLAFVGPAQQRITVSQLLDSLEQDYKARSKDSPQFLSHLKRIREAFGLWRAVNLTAEPEAIDQYINECKESGLASSTINRGTQLLAQAYQLSVERKLLNAVPLIRHLPERNARQGFFEDADFKAVLGKLPAYLADFVQFGFGRLA
jgi:hypothetical protein